VEWLPSVRFISTTKNSPGILLQQSQIFDEKAARMIWIAKTTTFDADELDDAVNQLTDASIDDPIVKGVIELD
jgi:hypothetical protein